MRIVASCLLFVIGLLPAMAIDETPASRQLGPMEKPGVKPGYVWEAIDENGDTYRQELISLDGNEGEWKDNTGCSWNSPYFDFAPATSWSNCSGGVEKGSQNIYETEDSPWPLSDETEFSYKVTGVGGGYSWRDTRRCEVVDQVRIEVPAGEYDTYKLVCKDKWNTRTWWVSPEREDVVAFKRRHKDDKNRRYTYRLVRTINP